MLVLPSVEETSVEETLHSVLCYLGVHCVQLLCGNELWSLDSSYLRHGVVPVAELGRLDLFDVISRLVSINVDSLGLRRGVKIGTLIRGVEFRLVAER